MMKHYTGSIGTFDYDDAHYALGKSRETNPRFTNEYLHYIGQETDGSKITYPAGLVDASNLYAGTNVASTVTMPEGVKSAIGMYASCEQLEHGDMFAPDSLTDQSFMYDGCKNLKTPGKISQNAIYLTGMYNGCETLQYVPEVPDSVKDIESFCSNSGVKTPFAGGRNVENAYGALAYCPELDGVPAELNPNAYQDDMITGCSKLQMSDVEPEKKISLLDKYQTLQPAAFDEIDFESAEFGEEGRTSTNIDTFVEDTRENAKAVELAKSRADAAAFVDVSDESDKSMSFGKF